MLWPLLSVQVGAAAPADADWRNPADLAHWPGDATVLTPHLSARLVAEPAQVAPGQTFDVALVFDIRPHWHTYWRNPGDSGEPPRIHWTLPDGIDAGPIRWPIPTPIPVGPLANYGYSGRVAHPVALTLPPDWPAGRPVEIVADATWLVCEEECIPEQGRFRLALPTAEDDDATPATTTTTRAVAALFAQARARLPAPGLVAADLASDADGLTLRIPAAALPADIESLSFFANDWGLIDHAAPQTWRRDGDWLELSLTPGDAARTASPAGLLVARTNTGEMAIEVSADPDPAAAGGDPAAVAGSAATGTDSAAAPAGSGLGLATALLFALLGGLVLNLMPCVFPVLAIKALGLARQGGAGSAERLAHGLAYTAGVLAFFAAVGLLLLALRAGGAAIGWGFQLQSPVFVALMAYLFAVLGLSLAGAATVGTRLMGLGAGGPDSGLLGAFVTGGLAALVAAPCTAPFMGAALGYALAQPRAIALAVILTLGLGMALPFLLLAASPALARRLPRPGAWMEHLKQFLAFPMFATVAWLVWVLSVQVGPSAVASVLSGLVLLALAVWLFERERGARGSWRWTARAGGWLALASAAWLAIALGPATDAGPADGSEATASAVRAGPASGSSLDAEAWSRQRLDQALASGRPVFVNMTAAWCITCLVNERVALSRPTVAAAFAAADVLYLKGDWTRRDPAITAYLADFGRTGVPIYVLYRPGADPHVLPQVLTEAIVLDALRSEDDV